MKRTLMLVVALALLVAACGGDSSADGVVSLDDGSTELAAGEDASVVDDASSTTLGDMTDEEAMLAFAACMRDNGIDMGDPTVDANGNLRLQRPGAGQDAEVDREVREAAFEECGRFMEGITQGFREVDQTEFGDSLVAFAECVRDNGFDMPDPDVSAIGGGGGPGNGPFGEFDRGDPAFIEAAEACSDILAGFGRGPGQGPGGGGDDA